MNHNQLMNTVAHSQVMKVQVPESRVQYITPDSLVQGEGSADSAFFVEIHFFIDRFLTDCQSYLLSGGDWIRRARNLEKGCEECSMNLNMNRDIINQKEVRT